MNHKPKVPVKRQDTSGNPPGNPVNTTVKTPKNNITTIPFEKMETSKTEETDSSPHSIETTQEETDHESTSETLSQENSGIDRTLTILQLGLASMLRLNLKLNGISINAVVDTAAEVTIISDKVYDSLPIKPLIKRRTAMHGAGRDMKMETLVIGPVSLKIGTKIYTSEVYVAPIGDAMLLGLDFMHKHNVILDCRKNVFFINGEALEMTYGKLQDTPKVSLVTVTSKTVIPPNSAVHVNGCLENKMQDYIVEPTEDIPVLMPRCLYAGQEKPRLCLVNASDRYYTIKKDTVIGQAIPADPLLPTEDNNIYVAENTCAQEDEKSSFPERLKPMFDGVSTDLDEDDKEKLKDLLIEYQDIFAKHEFDLGHFNDIEHSIDTGMARPIKQRMRRTPEVFAKEEESHLQTMLDAGIIEPLISEWASPLVLIRKKDGSVLWCIDYRRLNQVTIKEINPLPLIHECIDTLSENKWYSKLDANSAYYQIKVKESDKDKTAFITKYGLFQFTRMSFGLCNAPSTYARVMNLVLRGLTWNIVLAFLDDILVMGKNIQDHMINLRTVFNRFREHGLKLKPKKCELFQTEVQFLGRTINQDGMAIGEEYVKVIKDWPEPKTTKEVERFVGFTNYHRSFIKGYAKMAAPLQQITGRKPFIWTAKQQSSFESLKSALSSTPVLALPNSTDLFILDTDASDYAIGAELLQVQNGKERAIAYGSFTLAPEQQRYCTTRKELLAVVRFTKQFQHYLLGREFIVRTDHSSLTWLLNFKDPQGQLARWLEVLSQYNMKIEHRAGKKHVNADALSRISTNMPCPEMRINIKLKDLPCGGCKYCTRAHDNWRRFAEEIDDVIPLPTEPLRRDRHTVQDLSVSVSTLSNTNKDKPTIICEETQTSVTHS